MGKLLDKADLKNSTNKLYIRWKEAIEYRCKRLKGEI